MFNFSLHDISSHICLESLQTSPLMPSNPNNQLIILYINSVSQSICLSVEVLKPRSLLIKLSPRTRGPKNYSGPRVLTSYFYFYVRFHAATAGSPYFLLLLLCLFLFPRNNCRRQWGRYFLDLEGG